MKTLLISAFSVRVCQPICKTRVLLLIPPRGVLLLLHTRHLAATFLTISRRRRFVSYGRIFSIMNLDESS